ncbi:2'-5' RNA ligase family protein [Actinomyces bowdenii]|uniref:2'-5' RNA ligase family protein n=1 Tax=Actinomyces bowdenii TaxID=131109 RepID=A0A3P1VDL2_9ACTO|nr:2'-5' RNA ligase family protein [Actinomyces bowdenii]MBO3724783.1 2'-5' RNA ligase family protein [Actinomyces bowdenii]RRD30613.1 2'-5' RNA ligase family protein [Actinomyces bowdenii]
MNVPAPDAGQCVIGVAIALPEPEAARVRAVREAAGDPQALVVPPHITLLPPTAVEIASMGAITAHLERVAARTAPFPLRLQGVGTFRPVSPVVFLELSRGAQQCHDLQGAVRDQDGPLGLPLSFPFHPHVTLAHEIDDAALDSAAGAAADLDIRFTASRLHLYRFTGQGGWRIVAAPAFAAAAQALSLAH